MVAAIKKVRDDEGVGEVRNDILNEILPSAEHVEFQIVQAHLTATLSMLIRLNYIGCVGSGSYELVPVDQRLQPSKKQPLREPLSKQQLLHIDKLIEECRDKSRQYIENKESPWFHMREFSMITNTTTKNYTRGIFRVIRR